MNDSNPPNTTSKVISILRIILWLIPAIFIPVAMFVTLFITTELFRSWDESMMISISAIVAFVATGCVGYFDQRLALVQKKIPPPHDQKELARWTAIFILAQIIIAPTICYALLCGFCMVTGSL